MQAVITILNQVKSALDRVPNSNGEPWLIPSVRAYQAPLQALSRSNQGISSAAISAQVSALLEVLDRPNNWVEGSAYLDLLLPGVFQPMSLVHLPIDPRISILVRRPLLRWIRGSTLRFPRIQRHKSTSGTLMILLWRVSLCPNHPANTRTGSDLSPRRIP